MSTPDIRPEDRVAWHGRHMAQLLRQRRGLWVGGMVGVGLAALLAWQVHMLAGAVCIAATSAVFFAFLARIERAVGATRSEIDEARQVEQPTRG